MKKKLQKEKKFSTICQLSLPPLIFLSLPLLNVSKKYQMIHLSIHGHE
nr:hypothetical protein [Candidatus Cardinium sp. cBcalN1]